MKQDNVLQSIGARIFQVRQYGSVTRSKEYRRKDSHVATYMAHTLTEADQIERPGLTGEAAHDDVCSWLGFHSGPTLTDGIPALAGMYLHLAGILRAELPELKCSTPGAAFVVEGWERESEATRQLYAPDTGLLPQALRATKVGSVDHRNLTLAAALATDLDELSRYGLDPGRPETFAAVYTRVRYWPATGRLTARLFCHAMELICPPHPSGPGARRRLPAGVVGQLAFLQALADGQAALVTFECWVSEDLCDRTTREVVEPSIRAAAGQLGLGSADLPPYRTVSADLLSIMLPSGGSYYVAPAA
jgi:hypothetical protein